MCITKFGHVLGKAKVWLFIALWLRTWGFGLFNLHGYASVGGAPEAYGSRCVCVCVCVCVCITLFRRFLA